MIVPVEHTIEPDSEVMPYERVSSIIENGRSFMVVAGI